MVIRHQRPAWVQAEYERIGRERLEAELDMARVRRRDMFRSALECLVSCAVGLFGIGLAWHATDHATGMIFWWGGLAVGYSGIAAALIGAYRRGEKRGDW